MKRDHTNVAPFPATICLTPIARVRSPYTERHGTPRQPGMAGPKEQGTGDGTVEILSAVPIEAVTDLASFDRIWLLSWLHLNGPGHRALVRPPRGGPKRGVLATRAPHRPNPLALSCVELLEVDGRQLRVRGLDLIDGTPVVDIKPYIARFDAHPDAGEGWLSSTTNLGQL